MDAKKHAEKAEWYKGRAGDMIVREMAEAAEKITPEHFKHVADLCRMYCAIDDFLDEHDAGSGDKDGIDGWEKDYIKDELMAAEKYFKVWEKTGDAAYQQLAREELRHAHTLLSHETDIDEAKRKQYKTLHDQLAARIG